MKIALEHNINYIQKAHKFAITESTSATAVDNGAACTSARAVHNPWARAQSSGCHGTSGFGTAKLGFLPANTVISACSCLFHHQYSRSSRSFSRGGFLDRLSTLLLTGTSPKSCLGFTSILNEFFKNGVKISLATGCRYT